MSVQTLKTMGKTLLRVKCEPCRRSGQYRADRLAVLVGDVTLSDALPRLAAQAGCPRALNPPSLNSVTYSVDRCQIRVDAPAPFVPVTIGKAMHERWRGFIRCARHHQGLKTAKPCGVEAELDLATLVAALGYDFEVARLNAKLTAPCCGTRSFELVWYRPADEVTSSRSLPRG